MYTDDELIKIEQPITKLHMCERVLSVAYGDHIVNYAEVVLKDLLNLRSRIKSYLKGSTSLQPRMTFATITDTNTAMAFQTITQRLSNTNWIHR